MKKATIQLTYRQTQELLAAVHTEWSIIDNRVFSGEGFPDDRRILYILERVDHTIREAAMETFNVRFAELRPKPVESAPVVPETSTVN